MDGPLDELYLSWLYSQVDDHRVTDPSRTHWRLFTQLYKKEFVWFIPNDDNRIADGTALRYEFVDQSGLGDVDIGWIHLGCSMLELLIGLARRLSFEAGREPSDWFWNLLHNLGIDHFNDRETRGDGYIDEVLDRVIWRTYEPNGNGGLFPLRYPSKDQRDVELWYQLNAYVLEMD